MSNKIIENSKDLKVSEEKAEKQTNKQTHEESKIEQFTHGFRGFFSDNIKIHHNGQKTTKNNSSKDKEDNEKPNPFTGGHPFLHR